MENNSIENNTIKNSEINQTINNMFFSDFKSYHQKQSK